MRKACVLLRGGDHYRADAFRAGLERHGFTTTTQFDKRPKPGDLLLMWNRTRGWEPIAELYERAGATVMIAENGYCHAPAFRKFYALALGKHNGAGSWFVGDGPRFEIPEQEWRSDGDHVLVLPQRGIGSRGVAMPQTWQAGVLKRLKACTDRPIRIRAHPGPANIPLEPDFVGAHCVVTWGSGAGIKALQAGIPVFHEMPHWIGACAAAPLAGNIESCNTPSRVELWTRISWAQWGLEEIQSGEAMDRLINEPRHNLLCAGQSPLNPDRAINARRSAAHPLGMPA